MLRLIGLVVSIGLADSLNPTTIAPALYLATGERSRARVIEFTLGVFVVYLLGGVLVALGPGELLLDVVPKPGRNARHILEIVVGVAMLVAGLLLWRRRDRLSDRQPPDISAERRSSAFLGATIMAVELPTAFPYFAAIAAVVGSGLAIWRQLLLILLFNVCFVLPLLAIVTTLCVAGDQAAAVLGRVRAFLNRHWPVVLAVVAVLAGVFVILLGATGLTSNGHGRFGRFMRRFHGLLHP